LGVFDLHGKELQLLRKSVLARWLLPSQHLLFHLPHLRPMLMRSAPKVRSKLKWSCHTAGQKGRTKMNKRLMLVGASLLVSCIPTVTAHNAQAVRLDLKESHSSKHQFAVGLLRAINTAEATDHAKFGSYSPWKELLAHHSDYFDQFRAAHRVELSDAVFADLPEILPGWNL